LILLPVPFSSMLLGSGRPVAEIVPLAPGGGCFRR
jgi:antitoxin (DNA-binding transcriptional repressor) of toxin-antitoxin stability system